MKKLFLLIAAACVSLTAAADEGMWMLPYLQKMNAKALKERGCKLTPEEIYSVNHSSLKDAVVVFGGGCTGEIVSPEGLLLTNHHCGYGSIQELSSVENDFLKKGFWAMSQAEELPVPGLAVRFVRKIVDVTPQILADVPNIAAQPLYDSLTKVNVAKLKEQMQQENPGMEINIKPFFNSNQYFAFVLEVYTDVRLVGAPPSSIGNFGGETDNWMWPRHTCDFSVFRVYAGADNKPAEYAADNKPLKAEKFLKVSLNGYKEGDFAMIMGFPGSTTRYATSYEIDDMLKTSFPQRIFIRGERLGILHDAMMANDTIRIQYASKYRGSANYWKNTIGKKRGVLKLRLIERKQQQEAAFQQWAEQNTLPEEGFIDALPQIKEAVAEMAAPDAGKQYISEAILGAVELTTPALSFSMMKEVNHSEKAKAYFKDWYKDYNPALDRKVTKRMLTIARENMKDLPSFYTEIVDKDFGGSIDAYVDHIYDNSIFTSEKKVNDLIDNFSAEAIAADPAIPFVKSVYAKYEEFSDARAKAVEKYREGSRKYVAGLMRMQPDKAWAPDANFTQRLTYGRVLPYTPADGIHYNYYTTLGGVIAKEDPAKAEEFTVPEKLKELYAAKDFGRYANSKGELPVGFLADCDITGGNSGSPIMNARGELIGLAFDGNWEAMSGDIAFEPALQRTISVDIRYVLFIIDKYAGAGWLVDEMTIAGKK